MDKSGIITTTAQRLKILNFDFINNIGDVIYFRSKMAVDVSDIMERLSRIRKYYEKEKNIILLLEFGQAYGYVRFVSLCSNQVLQNLIEKYGGTKHEENLWFLYTGISGQQPKKLEGELIQQDIVSWK